jgi:hypothetical protein
MILAAVYRPSRLLSLGGPADEGFADTTPYDRQST